MSSNIQQKLSEIYYQADKPYGYATPLKLYLEAKKVIPNLTQKTVKKWFQTQLIPSRFSEAKTKFPRVPFMIRKPNLLFGADLCDMRWVVRFNNNYRYILVTQDMFDRKLVLLAALKTKTSKEVSACFDKLFKVQKCKKLITGKL